MNDYDKRQSTLCPRCHQLLTFDGALCPLCVNDMEHVEALTAAVEAAPAANHTPKGGIDG